MYQPLTTLIYIISYETLFQKLVACVDFVVNNNVNDYL